MALPLENLINMGFIPNIWQVMIIKPYIITLEHVSKQNLYLASACLIKLNTFKVLFKVLTLQGENAFGFPEGDAEICSCRQKIL